MKRTNLDGKNLKGISKSKDGYMQKNNQQKIVVNKVVRFSIAASLLVVFSLFMRHYWGGILYYLGFQSNKNKQNTEIYDVRNYEVLSNHTLNAVGIDVSEYQGVITWDSVKFIDETFEIKFVIARATIGSSRADDTFKKNYKQAKKQGFKVGAYHYYRPDENSTEQAQLFIQKVNLSAHDFPPILDIEKLPKEQSISNLKKGLKNWLTLVEKHYKRKPIIYTSERYYKDFLKDDFSTYKFWIANYNFFVETPENDWLIWQFTEKGTVKGIDGFVDINIYNGIYEELLQE